MRDQYRLALERVVNLVERSLSEPLALDELSAEAGLSKFHLHRVFRALTGYPLAEYVRRRRLSQSLEFLRDGTRSMTPNAPAQVGILSRSTSQTPRAMR